MHIHISLTDKFLRGKDLLVRMVIVIHVLRVASLVITVSPVLYVNISISYVCLIHSLIPFIGTLSEREDNTSFQYRQSSFEKA